MPFKNFTLKEFAQTLGLDLRRVEKMAQRDELPAERIGGEWRFNKVKVVDWYNHNIHTIDDDHLQGLEEAMGRVVIDNNPDDELKHQVVTELMSLSGIELDFPAKTKASVIRELVKLVDNTGLLYDPEGLRDALLQREEMCSTAMPGGVAIPHPRRPLEYATAEPVVCMARVDRGIPYGAGDGKMTTLFFLIACHDDTHHLHVLSRLARLLTPETIAFLNEVECPDEALEYLITCERNLAAN